MSTTRNLFINVAAQSPETAFVVSEAYPLQLPEVLELVYGDQLVLNIYLVDGIGDYDSISGLTGYTLKVGVGAPGGTVAAFQDSWTQITSGWTGTLDLNTAGIQTLLNSAVSVSSYLEVEITDSLGKVRTYGQAKVTLRNQAISGASSVPTPTADYFTKTETNAKFVGNQSSITALTGGTATDLDGIVTVGVAVGMTVVVILAGQLSHYQLQAGTTAENDPVVIRPDDFNASTNAKVWVLSRQDQAGYTHTQSTPATIWSVNHQLGYRPSSCAIWINNILSGSRVEHVDVNNLTVNNNSNQSGYGRFI